MREAEFADRLPRYDALVVDEAQDHDTAFAAGIGSDISRPPRPSLEARLALKFSA